MGPCDRVHDGVPKDEISAAKPAKREILAPIDGELAPIESVADPVFAQKMMGNGIAIVPTGSALIAPMDGELSALFPTGHAFSVEQDGLSVMVHAGIDTVELEGQGFQVKAAQGDSVSSGDTVVLMDPATIKEAGFDPTVMVVVLEAPEGKTLSKRDLGPVKAGEPILWLD